MHATSTNRSSYSNLTNWENIMRANGIYRRATGTDTNFGMNAQSIVTWVAGYFQIAFDSSESVIDRIAQLEEAATARGL